MALCIGCWVIDVALQTNKRDLEYNQIMLSSMYKIDTRFSLKLKGQAGYNQDTNTDPLASDLKNTPWYMPNIYLK